MVPRWALLLVGRIGNPVRIRDNTCCCEFHSARNTNLPNSLPLARDALGRLGRRNKSEDLPLCIKDFGLQVTGENQNSFYPYLHKVR